jgi:hypothetical protein
MFFGTAALLLGAIALWRHRRRTRVQALALSAGVVGAAVFGLPPVGWITDHVYPYSSINIVPSACPWLAVAGALGAGAGITSLSRRPLSERRIAGWAVAGSGLALGWLFVGVSSGRIESPLGVRTDALWRFALFFTLAVACVWALGRVRRDFAVAGVLLVCFADLWLFHDWNVWLPADQAYPRKPPAVAFLESRPQPFRMSTARPTLAQDVMPADTQMLYGLESLEGYDPPQSNRWADFAWEVLREGGLTIERPVGAPQTQGPALTAARMMNTRFWIAAPRSRAPNREFRTAYSGVDATVFEDRRALPRAYVVPTTLPASDDQALALMRDGRVDPRRVAVVPTGARRFSGGGTARAANVAQATEDKVRIDVPRGEGGWLVLAAGYSPRWTARVDGKATEVRPTNYAAMGVPVGPGAHEVVFELSRSGFWVGVLVSALACAAISALLFLRRPRLPVSAPERKPRLRRHGVTTARGP